MKPIALTQYSHGSGCGCKIAPKVLDQILKTQETITADPRLLVGNDTRDDAAVYQLDAENVIISTTDFFMPIVDDPFDFGGIASVNAISDIYAMGGTPLMAIAILGWPLDKLLPEIAGRVLDGARDACKRAGIILAGGHSIDAPEPIFGLAVTGRAKKSELKTNDSAQAGCDLYLTKPIGIGIMSTAQKKGILTEEDRRASTQSMLMLNSLGRELAPLPGVKALTDVTGFGLLGHLLELCEGSGVGAEIEVDNIPLFPGLQKYIDQKSFPGGTGRNFKSYGHKIGPMTEYQKTILCDPQTSGGLLVAVDSSNDRDFKRLLHSKNMHLNPIGHTTKMTNPIIRIL